RDGDGAQQREQLLFGSAREHPPVAMATASPGGVASSHLFDYGSTMAANGGDTSFYTSLISDVHYTTPRDSTYFTGIYQQENSPVPCSGSTEGFNTLGHPVQDVTGFESRGLFSSDSGIEMTPAESTEVDKTLADPMKVEAYKYMDMSRSEEIKYQEKRDPDLEGESPGLIDKYRGVSAESDQAAEAQGMALEGTKAAKERGSLEDEKSGDQHSASTVTAPVKITLTEIESTGEPASKETSPTKPETGLKPSHEVVPTVTVSEPEDDSPGSVTPPSSGTEPSGSESQGKGSLSEDELISAIKEAKGFSFEAAEAPRSAGLSAERPDQRAKPGSPAVPSPPDNEASRAEAGDSEIGLCEPPVLLETDVQLERARQHLLQGEPRVGEGFLVCSEPNSIHAIAKRKERSCLSPAPGHVEQHRARLGALAGQEPSRAAQPKGRLLCSPASLSSTTGFSHFHRESSPSSLQSCLMSTALGMRRPLTLVCNTYYKNTTRDSFAIMHQLVNYFPVSAADGGSKPRASLLRDFKNAIDLLYWRDIKQTGIVFGSLLLLLFSLTQFSVVSVVAYLALAGLSATISFRIYKSVLQAVQKTDEGHPFKAYLEMEMNLSQDQIQKYTDCLQLYVNSTVKELRRLFLVQDLVDSLKFAVLMWLLTYVGALFNGLTLLIMAVVSMFTLPVVYDKYQAQIDQYLGLVRTHINTVVAKIQAKIPGAKRKAE
ncbi:Reticulon-1, partial [Struthio camelus australis]